MNKSQSSTILYHLGSKLEIIFIIKVQNYNVTRQEKLMSIDKIVSESRNEVLNALKPILEEISNDMGITVLLEKNSVLLNAENMDITDEALKVLNKKLPSIDVSVD